MESIEPIESIESIETIKTIKTIKTINVTIKRADNSEHPTVLSSSDSILVLKQSISHAQSRAPAIVWLYNDTVLADDKTLSDYNVPQGATIIEITRRRGSMLAIGGNTIALGRIKPVSPDNGNKDNKDKKVEDKKVTNNLGLF